MRGWPQQASPCSRGSSSPWGPGPGRTAAREMMLGAPHPLLQAAVFSLPHLFSSQQCPIRQRSGVSGCGGMDLTGSHRAARGSPTPSDRGSPPQASSCRWWVPVPAFEVQPAAVAQPALPAPSGEPRPGARISASPRQGMNEETNRATTVGAARGPCSTSTFLEAKGMPHHPVLWKGERSPPPSPLRS